MRTRSSLPHLLLVCGVLAAMSMPLSSARAQDASATVAAAPESPDEEARRVFLESRTAYNEARFSDALTGFRRAYALSHRPELLYNVGQTADRLRLDRETVEAFEQYLREVPDAANRADVEARLAVLRNEIAREDALRAQAAVATPVAPPAETPLVEQWWLWTIVGVAAVGIGVGIGFAVLSHDELAAPIPGDIGMGGVVIALEGP